MLKTNNEEASGKIYEQGAKCLSVYDRLSIAKEYDFHDDEIVFSLDEWQNNINKDKIKILKADVNLNQLIGTVDLNTLPEIIIGNVTLEDTTYLNDFSFKSKIIVGNLNLSGLVSVKKLLLPERICGTVTLGNLTKVEQLVLPKVIEKDLVMNKVKSIKSNMVFPDVIGGSLDLSSLKEMERVIFPEKILGSLYLGELEFIKNVLFPKLVKGGLCLSKLEEINNLTLPTVVGRTLDLCNLKMATNSVLPEVVGRTLNLCSLTTLKNLKFPEVVGDDLILRSLETANKIELPELLGGDLEVGKLSNIEILILPKYIGGVVNLIGLSSVDKIIFPEIVSNEVWLGDFDKEKIKLPMSLKKKVITKNVPYDCFMDDIEFREYRSRKTEKLKTGEVTSLGMKIKHKVKKIGLLTKNS